MKAVFSAPGVVDLVTALEVLSNMFRGRKGPLLSTIHAAKGTEATRVIIYCPELIPSKYANTSWQRDQEDNLLYVAITRAQEELVYLGEIV